jgi:cation-transporting ATPase I
VRLNRLFQPVGALTEHAVASLQGRRSRRTWVGNGRAHIEVRGLRGPHSEEVAAKVKERLERLRGVHWAEVNVALGRVIVAVDGDEPDVGDLVEAVEAVEAALGLHKERFSYDHPEHPADIEPLRRNLMAVAADVIGLGVSTSASLMHAVPIPGELAAMASFIDSQPRLRRLVSEAVGPPVADLALALGSAFAQALGQGPLGLVVDLAHRSNQVAEIVARRRVWALREPELHARPAWARAESSVAAASPAGRPVPLPPGPVERWADRTSLASLAAFGAAAAATKDPRRSASLTLAGMPKAGRLGREAFAAQLGRVLASRGVVPFDSRRLRVLDRVDTVMLEAGAVLTGAQVVGRVIPLEGDGSAQQAMLTARVYRLYSGRETTTFRRQGRWSLGPLDALDVTLPRGTKSLAAQAAKSCETVLGLAYGSRLAALVTIEAELDPLAEELVAAIRRAGHLFVVAGTTGAVARRLQADRRTAAGKRLRSAVQELQGEGRVVALLATHGGASLRAADCGVGILVPGKPPPWGAHLICGPGLAAAHLVVEGMTSAVRVSRRSAGLAVAGSTVGGVLALSGPRAQAARRAVLPVNGAALAAVAWGAWDGARLGRRSDPIPAETTPWHAVPWDVALRKLGTSPKGLAPEEARRRRSGSSWAARDQTPSLAAVIVDELNNPLTPVLAAGAGLAAAAGSPMDAGLVGGVMGGNAVFSALYRRRTFASLRRLVPAEETHVPVRRSGPASRVPASELVVGDVVELEAGAVVPADLRLLEATALEVDESSLTGESLPVPKSPRPVWDVPVAERSSMLYDGTTIAAGTAAGAVVALFPATEIGRSIALARDGAGPPLGVQARLRSITNLTLPISLAGSAALIGNGLLRGRPLRQALGDGVSLGVAAVPEGLPFVANAAAFAGARRLSSRGALVGNPEALETLGRVDVLCFDKTGTLTLGKLSVRLVSDGVTDLPPQQLDEPHREAHRAVLAAGVRASPPAGGPRPPHATDRAVLRAARDAGVDPSTGLSRWTRIGEVPFEPARGLYTTVGESGSRRLVSVKGAPERVLELCTSWRSPDGDVPLDRRQLRRVEARVEHLAERGFRVLAVAQRAGPRPDPPVNGSRSPPDLVPRDLQLLGLLALADEARDTAAPAIAALGKAGVAVRMITGDHPTTAATVAAELGILNGGTVLTGAQLDGLSEGELAVRLPEATVFARVTPTQKVRIVEALQRSGRRVAMTGDGANDAPAIRLAAVGFAVGDRATPAAREAADVVIVGDELETIIDAIVEGRAMWASLRDALAILLGGNLGEITFELTGSALTGHSPLNPRQLLLTNLLTDLGPALAIALQPPRDRPTEELLREGPDASLGQSLNRQIVLRAAATAAAATGAWALTRPTGRTRSATVGLAALVGAQLGQTLVAGRRSPLVIGTVAVSGAALLVVVQTPGVSQFFGCTPLGPAEWATAAGAAGIATVGSIALPWAASKVGSLRHGQGNGHPLGGYPDANG